MMERVLICMIFGILSAIILAAAREVNEEEWRKRSESGEACGGMKIGLIDVDSHNFPNLALMKISAWHKRRGDTVEWWNGLFHYDIVYMSKVFTDTPDIPWVINADKIVKGGTGYGMTEVLPDEIEHIYPDYDLYGSRFRDTAFGFLSRGCPRNCAFCIVSQKEGMKSMKHSDLSEWHHGQRYIELMDPNLLACRDWKDLIGQLSESDAWINFNQGLDARMMTEAKAEAISRVKYKNIHFAWDRMEDEKQVKRGLLLFKEHAQRKPNKVWATVYVLTNFGTTQAEDLERVTWLKSEGYDPYIMIYDKPHATKETKKLARYVNNRKIFYTVRSFEEYKG